MAQGSKAKYTDKQKRKAEHIEEGYEDKGLSKAEAEKRAWATVNKQSGGGERSGGSGQKTSQQTKDKAKHDSAKRAAATRKGEPRADEHLEDLTKAELLDRARARQIAGRSSMRKAELVVALKQ